MKALELAKTVEHWVSCDAGIRGQECRAAAAELRRLAEVNAELLEMLKRCEDYFIGPTAWTPQQECGLVESICSTVAKAKEQQ